MLPLYILVYRISIDSSVRNTKHNDVIKRWQDEQRVKIFELFKHWFDYKLKFSQKAFSGRRCNITSHAYTRN